MFFRDKCECVSVGEREREIEREREREGERECVRRERKRQTILRLIWKNNYFPQQTRNLVLRLGYLFPFG